MSETPALTIGLPVYNGDRYLERTLASLAAQTFSDYELVICDNASTDRTGEISAAHAARDPRARHVRHPTNIGMLANFDYAVSVARGEFFVWAASDDLWEPRFAERLVGALRATPEASLAYCGYDWVDDDERPVSQGGVRFASRRASPLDRVLTYNPRSPRVAALVLHYLWRNPFLVYGVYRTEVLRRLMPFQLLFRDARAIDIEFLLRFFARERAVAVDETLFHYRAKDRHTEATREAYRAQPGVDETRSQREIDRIVRARAFEVAAEAGLHRWERALLRGLIPLADLATRARKLARR